MKVAACLCMEVPSAYGLFPQFGSTFCAGGRGGAVSYLPLVQEGYKVPR